MLPRNQPDRIRIVFDDHRLVANAGLLLPATLARHLGLRELVDHHLDLGGAPGRAKEGARHHGYTGKRGYHPLLAIAAGTGDVLMSRLREGRANTARGAAHFLRETVGPVRYAGANGRLTLRADSGFYTHGVVSV